MAATAPKHNVNGVDQHKNSTSLALVHMYRDVHRKNKDHGARAGSIMMRALAILLVITTAATLPRVALAASDDRRRTSILWRRGSIAVGDDALVSPSGDFSCGFHPVATNAYVFAVWFTASADPRTLAWAANRDAPVNGMGSRAELLVDGTLVLRDFDGLATWSTNTSGTGADRAQLLDTGNLVVSDATGRTLWQSFDWPTDTLLPGQLITRRARLVSAKARGSTSSGYFSFYFDNFNILNLVYDGPEINMNYWPDPFKTWVENKRTAFNSSRLGRLDDRGRFSATDNLRFAASDMGAAGHIMRRLTLDYDGNLRVYSLDVAGGGVWRATWAALSRQCSVHGICGRYGVCAYGLAGPACACPEGFEPSDPGDWSKGCRRLFDIQCGEDVFFAELANVDYWGFDKKFRQKATIDECRQLCIDDCRCEAFAYKKGGGGFCYTKIAVGVAKGLAYLHHECLEWILHCDMKPENVLLDADLEPKITGFGLVKLLSREDDACGKAPSPVQLGTRGHVAPEWALSLPITGKADVYSFGVVLLELLRGQRVSEWAAVEGVPGGDQQARVNLQEIVAWFQDQTLECQGDRSAPWLEEFVDARLLGDFNRLQAAVMLEVAGSCVEDDPSRRPNMNAVAQKLLSAQDVVGSVSLRRVCPVPSQGISSLHFV
ncbi:putative receptor protein kinase ZmPK1 [Triticum aestivum]|uniref:putative receptor protein kinase ZmPK1 n=1 Tax=Triticum aestivum TaxID=4565 RepID=UPI001D023F78|nr:putative receptor protein kinase ZmPK1 [Triticum aestivum]